MLLYTGTIKEKFSKPQLTQLPSMTQVLISSYQSEILIIGMDSGLRTTLTSWIKDSKAKINCLYNQPNIKTWKLRSQHCKLKESPFINLIAEYIIRIFVAFLAANLFIVWEFHFKFKVIKVYYGHPLFCQVSQHTTLIYFEVILLVIDNVK